MEVTYATTYPSYPDLPPREQVFRIDYWGESIPGQYYPKQPKMIPFKHALPRESLHEVGGLAIDVIDNRLGMTWITEPGTLLNPVEEDGPLDKPGALVLYDVESIIPFANKFLWNRIRAAARKGTDKHAHGDTNTPGYSLDQLVTSAGLPLIRADNDHREYELDLAASYRPERRDATVTHYIVSETNQRIYRREVGLGYIGITRNGNRLVGFDTATSSHAGTRVALPFNEPLELGRTITRKRNGGVVRSRLRAIGICGVDNKLW